MATILIIDTISGFGHIFLNHSIISGFVRAGFKVHVVARAGYVQQLELPCRVDYTEIPNAFYSGRVGRLRERVEQWRILRWLITTIALDKFDKVLFSCFDEIALLFASPPVPLLLLVHGNAAGLANPIKRCCIRLLGRRCQYLVFNRPIADRFLSFGIRNTRLFSHGIRPPYRIPDRERVHALASITRELADPGGPIVFVPTASKFSDTSLVSFLRSKEVEALRISRRITFAIKDGTLRETPAGSVLITRHLSPMQYRSLLLSSACVVLHYPPSFAFRVSAALFECIANDRPCVVSRIESFVPFEPHFTYNAFYGTAREFAAAIERALDVSVHGTPYINKSELEANYDEFAQA